VAAGRGEEGPLLDKDDGDVARNGFWVGESMGTECGTGTADVKELSRFNDGPDSNPEKASSNDTPAAV
jgi:hypothetical protein